MFGLSFNPFKSKALWGAVVALLGYLAQPEILAVLPTQLAAIVSALGVFLATVGMRDAATKPDVPS